MIAGLADRSVFVAGESGRSLDAGAMPEVLAVSVVTIAELRAGVLAAGDAAARSRRLATLTRAMELEPLPVDSDVADAWATLRVLLRDAGLRMAVNDSWIAATAIAHELALVTQDRDLVEIAGLQVVRV